MKKYESKISFKEEVKLHDVVIGKVKNSVFYNKKGKVIKVMDEMVNVDFGHGDVYGIMINRIENGEIVK